jgi:hypothetical protein
MDEPQVNMDSQDSPRPGLRGSYHLPPYSILCAWPQGQHLNVILLNLGVLKFSKLGLSQLWKPITLCADLRLGWGLKKSCSLRWEISNGIWHITFTQRNQGDSRLLVVFLLAITYVLSTQMDHASPFWTSTFQELSNGINNYFIQWVLTLAIAF